MSYIALVVLSASIILSSDKIENGVWWLTRVVWEMAVKSVLVSLFSPSTFI